jgi:hypothetical protein
MKSQQTEIEKKISSTIENLVIKKITVKPEYVRTYLSNDLATIYIRNKRFIEHQKRQEVNTFPVIKRQVEVAKPLIKKQLQKVLQHDILEIFPIIDPNGILIVIVVFCNKN